jgi:hypothetical protein
MIDSNNDKEATQDNPILANLEPMGISMMVSSMPFLA